MAKNTQFRSRTVNRAYVLIDIEDDRTGEVVSNLRCRPGITLADAINGPYHAIAVVESQDISAWPRPYSLILEG